jgi:hypothetical protein
MASEMRTSFPGIFCREIRQSDIRGGLARLYALGIFFRDIYIDTQSACLRDVKEIGLGSGGTARVDEVSNVRAPRRDDSVEWSINFLK